jgi:hypothetical protein
MHPRRWPARARWLRESPAFATPKPPPPNAKLTGRAAQLRPHSQRRLLPPAPVQCLGRLRRCPRDYRTGAAETKVELKMPPIPLAKLLGANDAH